MDVIHGRAAHSIYTRTDYLVNSDMAIPMALAVAWNYGVASEIERRAGLPPVDRRPQITPLVMARPRNPVRR